jgi:hypothetical protein
MLTDAQQRNAAKKFAAEWERQILSKSVYFE